MVKSNKDFCEVIAHAILECACMFECNGHLEKSEPIEHDSYNNPIHKNKIIQTCLDKCCPALSLKKIIEAIPA